MMFSSRFRCFFGLLLAALTHTTTWAGNWIPLFDGRTLSGWTDESGKPAALGAWRIEQGVIHLDRSVGRGGNLLTAEEFGDFELVFEWKIAAQANSGIKYRVQKFDGRWLGYEYQIIDDQNYRDLRPVQKTAALYDLFAPLPHDRLKPVGEFNRTAIIVYRGLIEHYLNGYRVVAARIGSPEWQQRMDASKFADIAGFGLNPAGRIMLTDHGDEVWYRNLFIRRLD